MVGVNKEGTGGARLRRRAVHERRQDRHGAGGGDQAEREVRREEGRRAPPRPCLFIAFAPLESPKIALAIIVENGGFGARAAAPIARTVFDYYLLGKLPQGLDVQTPEDERRRRGAGERLMELARFPLRRIVGRLAEGIDSTLLVLLLTLSMVGLAVLFSASYDVPGRVAGQVVNLAVALTAMWIVAQVPPQTMMRFAVPAYVVGLGLLVAVALAGDVVNGARRWLHVGVTRFQPSEMMKLALPLMLAWYFHKNETTLRLRDYFVAGVPAARAARPDPAPARPRHRRAGRHRGLLHHFLRRDELAGHRRDRRSRRRRAAAPVAVPARLPAPADPHAARSIERSARRGLPHHPVDDRRGLGRPRRQGLAERHPVAPRVHSRAPYRLHLRGVLGGVRPDRQHRAARSLLPAHRARAR